MLLRWRTLFSQLLGMLLQIIKKEWITLSSFVGSNQKMWKKVYIIHIKEMVDVAQRSKATRGRRRTKQ